MPEDRDRRVDALLGLTSCCPSGSRVRVAAPAELCQLLANDEDFRELFEAEGSSWRCRQRNRGGRWTAPSAKRQAIERQAIERALADNIPDPKYTLGASMLKRYLG
ncbi:MAG: hypothetical protein AB7I59_24795 [Geminicoccaceae bacterium]